MPAACAFDCSLISLGVAFSLAAPLAGAADSPPAPLTVSELALTQAGQQLVWTVTLAQPFSPAALASGGRSLCLFARRPKRRHRHRPAVRRRASSRATDSPRIIYQPVTSAGPGGRAPDRRHRDSHGLPRLTAQFMPTSVGMGYTPLRWQVSSTLGPPACTPPQPIRPGA